MISSKTLTNDWINSIHLETGSDPILVEKMIYALLLVEDLRRTGLDFIFKGGTSLSLVLKKTHRFSIDADIIVPPDTDIETYLNRVLENKHFTHYLEDQRQQKNNIPKRHFKFYFNSCVQTKYDSYVLLDVLFEESVYPLLVSCPIATSILAQEQEPISVTVPSVECLAGDKLSTFAPTTTGILYGKGKELEMIKQLFDISLLFDQSTDLSVIRETNKRIVEKELAYREINESYQWSDVIRDGIDLGLVIISRGSTQPECFAEIQKGLRSFTGYAYQQNYRIEQAAISSAKVCYLSSLLLTNQQMIERFEPGADLSMLQLSSLMFSKYGKLKKSNPEAFYYIYQAEQKLKQV